ncbi:NAD(P)-dependent dehydrogenase (short-subunit alcohol dehydrogenase family) [Nocardia tenerifensis]|uniref:NAD(P)-dependent dehydrogenase (Short-subunit alcohol dehydrogenase family) n=1 Tax=Nocardia tenerifensis TaxID=228006 RepID=A0A318K085_9NOCA|nr:SDR family oxidoreductase [Nocardia tenerifensis]PXX61042.1 NAD(P)-dependent dehydrogenase (short-subunit alcohol dehydrogenase family) [Nocardia tenerifensis]
MILTDKNAVIYGAGGTIGSAMAEGFAAEGANCFLVGRTAATLDAVAERIRARGGRAETAVVDALDATAVADHADALVERAGSLDISVNVTARTSIFTPLVDVSVADFAAAMAELVTSQLLTTKAAARHMIAQKSGVILFFGGSDPTTRIPGLGNVQVGCDAVEGLRRQWACELGPHGVRVVSLLTGGIPESFPDTPETASVRAGMHAATLLGRAATRSDVGHVAAFVASDLGRTLTATQVNISCGALGD